MRRAAVICLCLEVFGWNIAKAQIGASAQKPLPYFVGFHYQESRYEVYFPFPTIPTDATPGLWEITAGGSISPRITVQMGFSYVHDVFVLDPSYTGMTLSGSYLSGKDRDEIRVYCIPAMARYLFFSSIHARLQMDVIMGFSFLKYDAYSDREGRTNNVVTFSSQEEYHPDLQSYFTAGLGLRYRLGRHFEMVLDWTYNRNFHDSDEYTHLNTIGNKWGLGNARSLGLRYRFNLKKPTAAPYAP